MATSLASPCSALSSLPIAYLANKTQFREDILSNRIEEIVHKSFKGVLEKSVGASELTSWENSLRHMDTVLEDTGIPGDCTRRPGFHN